MYKPSTLDFVGELLETKTCIGITPHFGAWARAGTARGGS